MQCASHLSFAGPPETLARWRGGRHRFTGQVSEGQATAQAIIPRRAVSSYGVTHSVSIVCLVPISFYNPGPWKELINSGLCSRGIQPTRIFSHLRLKVAAMHSDCGVTARRPNKQRTKTRTEETKPRPRSTAVSHEPSNLGGCLIVWRRWIHDCFHDPSMAFSLTLFRLTATPSTRAIVGSRSEAACHLKVGVLYLINHSHAVCEPSLSRSTHIHEHSSIYLSDRATGQQVPNRPISTELSLGAQWWCSAGSIGLVRGYSTARLLSAVAWSYYRPGNYALPPYCPRGSIDESCQGMVCLHGINRLLAVQAHRLR